MNDRRVWATVDMSYQPMRCRQLKILLQVIPDALVGITDFRVRGYVRATEPAQLRNPTISPNMLRTLREQCPNLRALEIHEGFVDFRRVRM